MSGWLTALGPAGTVLSLLLLGHVLGEFVFQTDALGKAEPPYGSLRSHVGLVVVAHVVALIPLLTPRTVLIVAFVGVAHFLVDAVSVRFSGREATSVRLFLGDQVAHLVVLLAAWSLIGPSAWTTAPVVTALGGTAALPWSTMTTGAVYLAAFGFAHHGGNTLVRGVLPEDGPGSDSEDDLEAGSLIGSLERWIILLLGLAGLWGSVGLVVAAKSIARFEELKERSFAEYFLIGTLTSVLVAIVLVVLASVLV